MSKIVLITGPAGSGKTTVANELVKLFEKSARVEVDYIRKMIINGYVKPYPHTEEAENQIRISVKNACAIARNLVKVSFDVFIDDVVVSKDLLDFYYSQLKGYDFRVFLLLPSRDKVKERDTGRDKTAILGERALQLHDKFSLRKEEKRWILIDTTTHTVEQSVMEIAQLLK